MGVKRKTPNPRLREPSKFGENFRDINQHGYDEYRNEYPYSLIAREIIECKKMMLIFTQ